MPGGEPTVGTSVSILSLMITPVILILAAASLIGATTARLDRIGETMHELSQSFEHHVAIEHDYPTLRDQQILLWIQIDRSSRRVRLLQATIALLHVALTLFVLTSIGIGVDAASPANLGLEPVIAGLIGALLLLGSALILVYDSLIAMNATRDEARFTLRMTEHRAAQSRHRLDRPRIRWNVPRP